MDGSEGYSSVGALHPHFCTVFYEFLWPIIQTLVTAFRTDGRSSKCQEQWLRHNVLFTPRFHESFHTCVFLFLLTAPQLVTVGSRSRSLTGKWSGRTLATETRWFTSATPDSGLLAPRYGSASRTTAGRGCSQCASVSPRLLRSLSVFPSVVPHYHHFFFLNYRYIVNQKRNLGTWLTWSNKRKHLRHSNTFDSIFSLPAIPEASCSFSLRTSQINNSYITS